MKKFLIVAVTAATLTFAGQSHAEETQPVSAPEAITIVETDMLVARRTPVRNLLRGLLELERRKNAWLRRTFLKRA